MHRNSINGFGLVGGVVLMVSVSGMPCRSIARTISSRPTVLTADQSKNEEEPKGDPVDVDKLPKVVVDAVKRDMPGARITKAMILKDGNYYLDDVKVGKKLWDVTVTPKGKILKKVEMKD